MLAILLLVAPIFAVIALGFTCAKARYLVDGAVRGLVDYGYKVAMPAMLIRAMAQVGDVPVSPLRLLGAYGGSIIATWALATLATHLILRRPATDAPSIAMGACFGNGVMLGIPLILAAFGPDAATPIAFLVSIETAFLWLLGMTHYELAARGPRAMSLAGLGGIFVVVAKNPIVLAIVAGLGLRYGELQIPELPDRILALVGQSAIPVSLFGLGMALAAYDIRGQVSSIVLLCILKMLLYPALAFMLATQVFDLPPVWTGALVLFSAMPVGNNAFLFAARYDKAVGSVSAAVAISTPLAVLTVTVVIVLLQAAGLPAYRQ
ncbi:MAG: AEC family transporter [Hyphomicrobiaceae bacterium]